MKIRPGITMLFVLVVTSCFGMTFTASAEPTQWQEPSPPISETFVVQRIVSLAPNVTEMLFFLGYGDIVVGRTDFCNYPPETQSLPTVGGFVDTSLEKIISLNPDLVVAYQGNSLELLGQLEHLKVPVLIFREAQTLREISAQMQNLQHVLGKDAANEKLAGWEAELRKLVGNTNAEAQPTMLFGYPGETTFTCGSDTFLADLIRTAGAKNVTDSLDGNWVSVSAEFVLTANPDWILTATSCTGNETVEEKRAQLLSELGGDPVWSALKAVQSKQVIVLDSDVLLRPGPRILDALHAVSNAINAPGEQE